MEKYLLVMVGAAVGGLGRYLLATAVNTRFPLRGWYGTVIVNITGCFLIGIVLTILQERNANPNWRLLLVVGLLGGYTTFSSFAWETYALVKDGEFAKGFANVAVSVVAGYLALWCGALLARR
ncbi:MAG TPA: fluoride efflux transporter CrcB [Bryobacteraceae bacterium]|jgi:CrcB protein|nr:fluoride efflux transporter CrcB [Bryobacteraceae bacterium]